MKNPTLGIRCRIVARIPTGIHRFDGNSHKIRSNSYRIPVGPVVGLNLLGSLKSSTRLYSSPSMLIGRLHEINIRLAIGSTLSGLGCSGVMKLLGALNLPPPFQENKFLAVQEYV